MMLSNSADWDTWIIYIRIRAASSRIWPLIDPSSPVKKPHLVEPPAPVKPTQATDETSYQYKIDCAEYKLLLLEYKEQQAAFRGIIDYILDTILPANIIYIQNVEVHPYVVLVALKERLAPSDEARSLSIEREYRKLCEGPRNQKTNKWLDEWTRCYIRAKECGLGEATGDRPVRDFLLAVDKINPAFATAHWISMRSNSLDMFDVIKSFRVRSLV